MSIRPVDMSGVTLRTQDMSTIKANEDAKPFVDQLTIETQQDRNSNRQANRVNEQNDSDKNQGRFDAREKGSNQYQDNRKKRENQNTQKKDMAVVKKTTGGFDVRI